MSQTAARVNGQFAPLNNVIIASTCMKRLLDAASHLPHIGVLRGKAGLGKTSASCYLVNKYNAYRIECKSVWNRNTVLTQILKVMGIEPESTMSRMLDQICAQLMTSGRPLIIDELDHLVAKSAVEVIRDIHDGSGNAPILLIGEENIATKLERWERVHSRVLDWSQVLPLESDDCRLLADFYCSHLDISDDMLEYVRKATGGSARRICVNLEMIDEMAKRNGVTTIDRAAWGNEPLYTGKSPTGVGK